MIFTVYLQPFGDRSSGLQRVNRVAKCWLISSHGGMLTFLFVRCAKFSCIQDSEIRTNLNPDYNLEDNKMQENDDLVFTPDDLVNFPSTTNSEQTEDILKANKNSILENKVLDDPVNFPHVNTNGSNDKFNVKLYNKTIDNNASLVVLRLKQLLQSEIKEDANKHQEPEHSYKKQKRVVYINNQRVELQSDEA